MEIEELLLNRFDMSDWETGFKDRFSHMSLAVPRNRIALGAMGPSGLIEWRQPVTETTAQISLRAKGDGDDFGEIYASQTEYLPWAVRQRGVHSNGETEIAVESCLAAPAFNRLLWHISFELVKGAGGEYTPFFTGRLVENQETHTVKPVEKGVVCVFYTGMKENKMIAFPQLDGTRPRWLLRSPTTAEVAVSRQTYRVMLKPLLLKAGEKHCVDILLDYDNVPIGGEAEYPPPDFENPGMEKLVSQRREEWAAKLGRTGGGFGDQVKKLRAAAGLIRTGYKWRATKEHSELIASNCTQSGWSCAFFWDSLVAAAGIAQFNPALAENAVEALFVRQREDGCVPTSNYENLEGSGFYPQAPITGWALMRLWEKGRSADFIARIIGKVDNLFHWFIQTQDHDGDGLPEWRFTGCPADNSPIYDHYALPIQRDLSLTWCIYLPPVASVSLASYLIMDAKCLAFLYKQLGNEERSAYFIRQAGRLEAKLKEICVKDGELFFDYDHHIKRFNAALTLHSFLPLWAGVEMKADMKKRMIEEYLLNQKHFFGEKPLPYLAYSEDAYKPTGYWRGRIWTHVSFWIVEALWAEGYEKEADEAADRLIGMINQGEKFLENYYSSPDTPGGGSTDYNWGMASYLLLADRTYRKPVTLTVRG